ncbi:hypothetical protein [Planctomycetes bacterium K23_9]|uniref:hypothetical protein n=1 Tax=Stieleria marina TaxID=1930275 RepID=UPI0011A3F4D4
MTNSQRLETVRTHVRQWLADHCDQYAESIRNGEPSKITESIVIRDEHYCGRCFSSDQFRALWFIEEDELKFLNDTGVVAVFRGEEIGAESESDDHQINVIKIGTHPGTSDEHDRHDIAAEQDAADEQSSSDDQDVRRAA